MGNLLTAEVKIKGVRPLLWHYFNGEVVLSTEKKEREGAAGNNPGEWRQSVLVTKDGQLYVKHTYVFGAIRGGAKMEPKKRGNWQAMVATSLQVKDNVVLIDRWFPGFPNGHSFDIKTVDAPPKDENEPVYLDVSGVVNPSTKGRNVRYRIGASSGWKTKFSIMWDKTVVDRNVMQAVMNNAGMYCGLGDGRSVGYGRFEVEDFIIVE